jgi:hypothetical protein
MDLTARGHPNRGKVDQHRMESRSVELHIEELVLPGVDPHDWFAVAEGLKTRLEDLLAREGYVLPTLEGDRPVLDLGIVEMPHGSSMGDTGAVVAEALHRGISG